MMGRFENFIYVVSLFYLTSFEGFEMHEIRTIFDYKFKTEFCTILKRYILKRKVTYLNGYYLVALHCKVSNLTPI